MAHSPMRRRPSTCMARRCSTASPIGDVDECLHRAQDVMRGFASDATARARREDRCPLQARALLLAASVGQCPVHANALREQAMAALKVQSARWRHAARARSLAGMPPVEVQASRIRGADPDRPLAWRASTLRGVGRPTRALFRRPERRGSKNAKALVPGFAEDQPRAFWSLRHQERCDGEACA